MTIPVGLSIASAKERSAFRTLHAACGTPVQQPSLRCPRCEVVVARDEEAKGYEFAKGQFVVFERGELEAALRGTRVELARFVSPAVVPDVVFDRSHWASPPVGDLHAVRAYRTLADALGGLGLGGLGKLAWSTNEWPVLVTEAGGALLVRTLFVGDELRPPPSLPSVDVDADELALMRELVEAKQTPLFSLRRLARWYAPKLPALIAEKQATGAIAVPEPATAAPRDLEEALRASVRKTKRGRRSS